MSFNPFNETPERSEKLFFDFKNIYPESYLKDCADPFTKTRVILMNGTEYEAVWYSHQFSRHCKNNDLRRELEFVRRSEQMQQKKIACLKPKDEGVLETTIAYEQLAVELTAILAQREPDKHVKAALDFALLEDFDHLYRYADLLDMEQGIQADKLVGGYTEITPGRPTLAHPRHPYDEIRKPVNFKKCAPITKLDVAIITAAEQQTMNYYMNQCAFYESDLGRRLYQEIALVEEEHVTQYGSFMDVNEGWLECWLNHEYTECYLYYSCWQDETDKKIKKLWEQCLLQEITHLHLAADALKRYGKKEWQQVIPNGEFPELLLFSPQEKYVRKVLAQTVENTALREGYINVNELGDDADFFAYQKLAIGNDKLVPSHQVIRAHIDRSGMDYRAEHEENPIPSLRNRTDDNIRLGRTHRK